MDLPTRADLVRVGRSAALAVPGALVPAREFDRTGSNANLLLALAALMGEEVVNEVRLGFRDLLLDTAVGQALDRLVFDRYGLVRKAAARATGTLRYSRATVAGGAGSLPAGQRARSASGVVVETTAVASFTSTATTVEVGARALLSGTGGSVPASSVTLHVDPPFDSTITVSNPSGFAGGADAESDANFRARARKFLPTIRRGILGALEFGALEVAGVDASRAVEVLDGSSVPATAVELYILDAAGRSNSDLAQAVRDKLLEYRAIGVPVRVVGGAVFNQPITIDLSFETGTDSLAAAASVRNTIASVINSLDIGETMRVADIIAAARSVPGVVVAAGAVSVPVSDVVPATNQAIRTSAALITIT